MFFNYRLKANQWHLWHSAHVDLNLIGKEIDMLCFNQWEGYAVQLQTWKLLPILTINSSHSFTWCPKKHDISKILILSCHCHCSQYFWININVRSVYNPHATCHFVLLNFFILNPILFICHKHPGRRLRSKVTDIIHARFSLNTFLFYLENIFYFNSAGAKQHHDVYNHESLRYDNPDSITLLRDDSRIIRDLENGETTDMFYMDREIIEIVSLVLVADLICCQALCPFCVCVSVFLCVDKMSILCLCV